MPRLFHHLLTETAAVYPHSIALKLKDKQLTYQHLARQVACMAQQLCRIGLTTDARLAIYLPKQFETVVSFFATSQAGGIFVPVNPLLKASQVDYLLQDSDAQILLTSLSRYQQLKKHLTRFPIVILTDCDPQQTPQECLCWNALISDSTSSTKAAELDNFPARISQDIAAILYTSGSTGNPKGVVLSHQNLVVGATSVAEYLNNQKQDQILAVLPFSFDYGLSQLTTAFLVGACVVLMEYLMPRDVIRAVEKYQISALAAVPPLWIQLAELEWPDATQNCLRYITNSGGAMPQATLNKLMQKLPRTQPFLMYGLTEAFRSTYLAPEQIQQRPTSIGKAIPDAQIFVLNANGEICLPGEHGELVHRGPHVAQGYWNAPEKTSQRFKPLPKKIATGLIEEIAVWSGDTVVQDEAGFLYFIGRQDDMIKSSGYRISPSEIEDCVYSHETISEVTALGITHPTLGQAIVLVIRPENSATFDEKAIFKHCQQQLPNFMQPKSIQLKEALPRNPNGKINRQQLALEYAKLFQSADSGVTS